MLLHNIYYICYYIIYIIYKCRVLEAIGPKALGLHLRKFCDYLASQLESCQTKQPFLQCTDSLKAMIWDYHIFTLDRFILCLVCLLFHLYIYLSHL